MTDTNLDLKHPLFIEQEADYRLWRDLYLGGRHVEGRSCYLPKHMLETKAQYEFRLRRAAYRNYAKPIIGVWVTHVWRKAPTREGLPAELEAITADVDRNGESADRFFREVTRRACYQGVHFVLVDSPSFGEEIQTKADADAQGIRPYFVSIDPLDLIDWAIGEDGALEYVVIRESVEESAVPFQGHTITDQWRVWMRDRWEVWRKGDKGEAFKYSEGVNQIGVMPVVPFYFSKKQTMVGDSLIADFASLCMRIYLKENEKDICEFYTAIPFIFFKGFSEDDLKEFVLSSSNGVRSDNAEADIKFIEASGQALDSQRQSIEETHQAIQEIALRQIRPLSKQAEAALSKKIDKVQLDTQLAALAQDWSESERRCWEIAGKYRAVDADGIAIAYNTDFTVEEVEAGLLTAMKDLRGERMISAETLLAMLQKWELLPEDFDIEEERAKLENESRQGGSIADLAQRVFSRKEQEGGQAPSGARQP
ncbi:MAG: DUF4055 domain-containing protein [Acidobacteriota bacterium]